MARLSIAEAAKRMGLSERRLYRILREKTASRDRAEELALYRGGNVDDYLRAARPRGRLKRDDGSFTFRQFVLEHDKESDGISDECREMMQEFCSYYAGSRRLKPPNDFETLEHLIGFITNANFYLELRSEALSLWKHFKIWRIQQECAERIFAVEVGDDVS